MKKSIAIALGSLLIGCLITGFVLKRPIKSNSKAEKEILVKPDASYEKALLEAGFKSVPSLIKSSAEESRKYYKNKYGVNYISDGELKILLRDNGFLIGESSFYIGDIPLNEGKIMLENLKAFSDKEEHFDRIDYARKEFLTQQEAMDRWLAHSQAYDIGILPLVFIAAPKEQFDMTDSRVQLNDDYLITAKNTDPIALYKIRGGWLELAKW